LSAALSPEWFAAARDAIAGVALPDDRACRIQFDVDGTQFGLVVDGGRVTTFDLGAVDGAEVELRWPRDVARRILSRELRGNDAILATTVVAATGDGTYTGTPAPLNLSGQPGLDDMPEVPGASFTVRYINRDGPFGHVHYVLRFEDGRLADERLEELDQADVLVDVTYRSMALVRSDEITILEALETGNVQGEIGPLATIAGIQEAPEFHDAEIATGRHAIPLSVLGELDAHTDFGPAIAKLAAEADWG
jgi:hypothetical protein